MCFKRKKKEEIDVENLIKENETLRKNVESLTIELNSVLETCERNSRTILIRGVRIRYLENKNRELSNKLNSIKHIMDSINYGVRLNALKDIRELLEDIEKYEVTNDDQTGEN